jgi:IPT/TIG domain-containing protein/PASTA domain-containing protein/List-Bact-rpt repeat protein
MKRLRHPIHQLFTKPGLITIAALALALAFLLVPAAQALAAEAPNVTGLSPNNGPAAGGNSVTIEGTEFTGATEVKFGNNSASFSVLNSTEITATAPAGEPGQFTSVIITTPEGSSTGTSGPNFPFTYFYRSSPGNGTLTVEFEGSGSGEVATSGSSGNELARFWSTEPDISCTYDGSTSAGTCTNSLAAHGFEAEVVKAIPAPGSEFVEWNVVEGVPASALGEAEWCHPASEPMSEKEEEGDARSCWAFNESSIGAGSSENVVIKPVFAPLPPSFPLTVTKSGTGTGTVTSTPPGINCGATCTAEFEENEVVTLSPSAATGSEFKEWTGACTGSATCEVTMSATKSVAARFDLESVPPPKFKLTVTKSGTGSGTVKGGSPGEPNTINCGATCEHEYLENGVVTLTHEATTGSEFVAWTGACTGSGTCEVTMSAVKSVGASFNTIPPATFNLKVVKAGSGSGAVTSSPSGINCGSECEHAYNSGTLVTLTANASAGSTFAGWSGAGCSGTGTCVVTMSAAKEATATFNTTPPTPTPVPTPTPTPTPVPAPTPPSTCLVPKLAAKSLGQAKSALKAAHCALGKVTKPKKSKGALVVKSTSPGAGKVLADGSKVNLKLGPKPKKK